MAAYNFIETPLKEYQFFPTEYFSGSDVRIYFGDLLIDEILSLQVSMVEAVQPVFSFQGYTYSKVMRGQRQISGSFTIAYRETGWLHRVLAEEKRRRDQQTTADVRFRHPDDQELKQIAILYERGVDEYIRESKRRGIEALREEAERLQQAAWRQYPASAVNPSPDGPRFQAGDPEGFSIIIVAGIPLHDGVGKPILPYGTSTITGVQLVGFSTVVDNSGEPVMEQYSFIAKDLGGPAFRR